jgi:hypothetical protein
MTCQNDERDDKAIKAIRHFGLDGIVLSDVGRWGIGVIGNVEASTQTAVTPTYGDGIRAIRSTAYDKQVRRLRTLFLDLVESCKYSVRIVSTALASSPMPTADLLPLPCECLLCDER